MSNNTAIIEQIKKQRLLPLFYHNNTDICLEVVKALYAAGITLIEFTNRGEAALNNFKLIAAERNNTMPNLLLAAGTIRTAAQANNFIEAGADFLVSPVFDQNIFNAAAAKNKLWIPGCMTPTEVHVAELAGCKLIKLFPGSLLLPAFVSSIKELFPDIDFMPTGGVEVEKTNLEVWFNAGVCAVGMGSKLISKQLLDNKDYSAIENNTRHALSLVQTLT